jgi:hypothetical protein
MSLGTLLERPQPGRQPATLPPPARTQPPAAPPPSTRPGRPAPSRDLFVDLVRVGAVVVIVVLHWLMPVLDYADVTLTTANAFATGNAWAITWVSQVMPLIFFAGGAAAAISLPRRWARQRNTPATTASWVADRLRRLIVPVLPLAAGWLLVPAVLVAIGIPDQPVQVAAELVGRLLWFLGAYLVLVTLTPVLLRLHDRFRGREVVVLALGAIAVDWLRFGWLDGAGWVGFLNVVLVWGAVYQVGVHYGRGRRWSAARSAAAFAIGLVTLTAAVAFGPYPASMIGMPGEPVSNMNPPTAVLLALAAAQLGALLAVRRLLVRWAARPPVTAMLGWVSSRMMTIYLWHTPALVLVAGVAVLGFGLTTPVPFSAEWRTAVPLWLAVLTAVLAMLVQFAARFEAAIGPVARETRPIRVAAAMALAAGSLVVLTVGGFSRDMRLWPLAATLGVAAAVGLASGRSHPPAGWVRAAAKARVEA